MTLSRSEKSTVAILALQHAVADADEFVTNRPAFTKPSSALTPITHGSQLKAKPAD